MHTERKKRSGRVAVSFVRAATVMELPHPQSLLGVASRWRKDALLIFSRHVSLYFTATLRSVLGRGFVLFRSGGKTSIQCATPAVLKEKECI